MIDGVLFAPPTTVEDLRAVAGALRGAGYRSALEQVLSVLFLPSDDPALRSQITELMAATPQHVLASAFADHLINYDAAAAACRAPIAYIGAEFTMANLPMFREFCPHIKVGQTLGSGHFSTLLVPDQIIAMLQGLERAYAA